MGYLSWLCSLRGFCTCPKPSKSSAYSDVVSFLWFSSSWTPPMETQMGVRCLK